MINYSYQLTNTLQCLNFLLFYSQLSYMPVITFSNVLRKAWARNSQSCENVRKLKDLKTNM